MIRRSSAPLNRKCGVLISRSIDADRVIECEIIQCCHCQFSKPYAVGDERKWGVCWRCNDWHCPKPECARKCVPIKRWLENKHKGLPDDFAPVIVRGGYAAGIAEAVHTEALPLAGGTVDAAPGAVPAAGGPDPGGAGGVLSVEVTGR